MEIPDDIAAAALAELDAEIEATVETTTRLRAAKARLDESMIRARHALVAGAEREDVRWHLEPAEFAEAPVPFRGPGKPSDDG
ncbi:MAG: hypothetical protein AAF968_24275 [Pseudomonadota bacterium]